MEITYSGLLTLPARKDAPLVVMKGGALTFEFHPDPDVMRARIEGFHDRLMAMPESQKDGFDIEEQFCDGMYIRKIRIKKGDVLVGKIHRKPCVNFVESGDLSVITETGVARIKPGFNVVSPAGLQKVGIAHEDSVFVNVFRTDTTDPVELEKELTVNHRSELAALGLHSMKEIES